MGFINSYLYLTPIGKIKISENGKAIVEITTKIEVNSNENIRETPLLKEAYMQLSEYFRKERNIFNLPIEFNRNKFSNKSLESSMRHSI